MGGGASSMSSTNVKTSSVIEALTRNIMNCQNNTMVKQQFYITGDYNMVVDSRQVQYLRLSAECVQDAQNLTDLQTEISTTLQQIAKSQSPAVLGALGSSSAEINTTIDTEVRQTMTQETILNIINQTNAEQILVISGNNNIVKNFTQDQTSNLLFQNAQNAVNSMRSVQIIENESTSSADAVQTNPISDILDSVFSGLNTMYMIIAAVIIAVVIFMGPELLKFASVDGILDDFDD